MGRVLGASRRLVQFSFIRAAEVSDGQIRGSLCDYKYEAGLPFS
jgi:hypothetical protein